MSEIELGPLAHGPHAAHIRAIAAMCAADERILASWLGGSLAAGRGDMWSDIDLRIAVEPGQLDAWASPDWSRYLPLPPCGSQVLRFGEHALLHHLLLADGTILDFFVQDTLQPGPEPRIVILTCRNLELRTALESAVLPPAALAQPVDPAQIRQFLVEYWIITYKQNKALARKYDATAFMGLYLERFILLRAWYMQATGMDINAHPTLHVIGMLHSGLAGTLSAEQNALLGMPSRTPAETAAAIEAVRAEMIRAGHWLATQYGFAYPQELEDTVLHIWGEHKATLVLR